MIPQDLDIFVSANDVYILEKHFSQLVTTPVHLFNDKGKDLLEFQMKVKGITVEVCELDNRGEIVYVPFKGEHIPVAPLSQIREEYASTSTFQDRLSLMDKRLKELQINII